MRIWWGIVAASFATFVAVPESFGGAAGPARRVDGVFDEWASLPTIATDPAGDAAGPFDITQVQAFTEGTRVFLRFNAGQIINIQSGPAADIDLNIIAALPTGHQLEIRCRRKQFRLSPGPPTSLLWSQLGYVTGPTFASDQFEVSFDLAAVGVRSGDTVSFNFTGSDALVAPFMLTLDQPVSAISPLTAAEQVGTSFRLVSLNTEQSGLISAARVPAFTRLVRAVPADIYCFQEEYNSTGPAVAAFMNAANPHGDGGMWQVHKWNDCAIATRGSIQPLPSYNTAYAAAVVDLGGNSGKIVVLSIHPKCCGYIGNPDDALRIQQTTDMLRTLRELRDGMLGPAFESSRTAPVIVTGDWNLVGSRTPLTMLEAPIGGGGAALTHWLLDDIVSRQVQTWRDPVSTFSPGVLDLTAYDAAQLRPHNGFLLDTLIMPEAMLLTLGLQATDSDASDHKMLVTDFAVRPPACPGDASGDGMVSLPDIADVIEHWGVVGIPGETPGDPDGDGTVGQGDLMLIIAHWGAECGRA